MYFVVFKEMVQNWVKQEPKVQFMNPSIEMVLQVVFKVKCALANMSFFSCLIDFCLCMAWIDILYGKICFI